jgi:hypothetical protein
MTAGSAIACAVDKPLVEIDRRTERVGVNGITSQTVEDSISVRRLQSLRRSGMVTTCQNRTLT